MNRWWKDWPRTKVSLFLVGSGVFAVLLYLAGIKPLLPLLVMMVGVRFIPAPALFASWFSRLFLSALVSVGLLQMAAVVQFLVFPNSDFKMVALLFGVLAAGLFLLLYTLKSEVSLPKRFISKQDICALLVALFFLAPFTPIFLGQGATERIATIGGLQSPDAQHHHYFKERLIDSQHLDTSGYPKSFHLAVGFLQDSFMPPGSQLSWQTNVKIYFAEYMIMGVITALTLYYLAAFWLQRLVPANHARRLWLLLAASLAPPMALVGLWPFISQGFFNYYYVAVSLAFSVMYLGEYMAGRKDVDFGGSAIGLLFAFATVATWPLLLPVTMAMLVLLGAPFIATLRKRGLRLECVALLLLALTQIVPVALQLRYTGSTDINDLGSLRVLHPLFLLAGLGVLVWSYTKKNLYQGVFGLFLPLFVLSGLLVLLQVFLFGEPRYFAIKVSLLLEMFIAALGVSMVVAWSVTNFRREWVFLWFVPCIPLVITVLLLTSTPTPLKETRDLFRKAAHQEMPQFYEQDVQLFTRLGEAHKIDYANATVLHYDAATKRLFGHSLLAGWVQNVKYNGQGAWAQNRSCHRLVYRITTEPIQNQKTNQRLIAQVKACIAISKQNNQQYYIITDSGSLPYMKQAFGQEATIVSS